MKPLARLGEVMRLNGAVPRGADLQAFAPRRCRGCTGLFLRPARARTEYCDDCRAKACPSCTRPAGRHAPSCSSLTPRPCRGCGVEMGHGVGNAAYCPACRRQQCPECRHYAGRHGAWCLRDRRQHRGTRRRAPFRGLVTNEDIVDVFVRYREPAVRLARRIVGGLFSEDIVHDVFLYFLDRRDELKQVPTRAFVLTVTRNFAYMWRRPLIRQRMVPMDPAELVHAEALMWALEHGRPRTPEVSVAPAASRAAMGAGA